MKIETMKVEDLVPYERNPRDNDKAVDAVANSIKEFGFLVPVVIDKDNVVAAGHTRIKAAKKLGIKEVPAVRASDLTDEQIRAFRLADNKTGELAGWDFIVLDSELKKLGEINMEDFGFNLEEDEDYKTFVEKFEEKKTTDDCYTPPLVYDAVAEWVSREYKVSRSRFVRPFKPNGDYQAEKYGEGDIVVDNPPFSIMREIIDFYTERGIKYFLFAPALALFNYVDVSTAIALQCPVEYENGAIVPTSFLTNLEEEGTGARSSSALYKMLNDAVQKTVREKRREIPRYDYPDEIVTAAMLGKFSKYGQDLRISRMQSQKVRILDEQREKGNAGIYGCGLILSEKAAAEKAAAEKAAAEKWTLSEREREIVKELSKND